MHIRIFGREVFDFLAGGERRTSESVHNVTCLTLGSDPVFAFFLLIAEPAEVKTAAFRISGETPRIVKARVEFQIAIKLGVPMLSPP
jgi:hypothetical protein